VCRINITGSWSTVLVSIHLYEMRLILRVTVEHEKPLSCTLLSRTVAVESRSVTNTQRYCKALNKMELSNLTTTSLPPTESWKGLGDRLGSFMMLTECEMSADFLLSAFGMKNVNTTSCIRSVLITLCSKIHHLNSNRILISIWGLHCELYFIMCKVADLYFTVDFSIYLHEWTICVWHACIHTPKECWLVFLKLQFRGFSSFILDINYSKRFVEFLRLYINNNFTQWYTETHIFFYSFTILFKKGVFNVLKLKLPRHYVVFYNITAGKGTNGGLSIDVSIRQFKSCDGAPLLYL
jgi:hypothetical protein